MQSIFFSRAASNDSDFVLQDELNHLSEGSMIRLCQELVDQEHIRLALGQIAHRSWLMLDCRIRKHIAPFYKETLVININSIELENFKYYLEAQKLSHTTIKQYFNILRKIFRLAYRKKLIQFIPEMPRIPNESNARGGFTVNEYKKILRYAKKHQAKDISEFQLNHVQTHRDTRGGIYAHTEYLPREFAWLIGFMVNSFLRPVDIKLIQHRHVLVIRNKFTYLKLLLPETKKHKLQIVTLAACVHIYEKLLTHSQAIGYGRPNDYLFLPHIQDRDAAMYLISKYFRQILNATNLRYGPVGQARSLYSLRHTAITFRLLFGRGIDLLTLAKNARTSVEMIEKFYASQLSPEMNIEMLQSRRSQA